MYEPKPLSSKTDEDLLEVFTTSRVCVKCGGEADLVREYTPIDIRLEEFYCPHCHTEFVTTEYGKFVREGNLHKPKELELSFR